MHNGIRVGICVFSDRLSGAQKRFIRLANELVDLDQNVVLIINQSLCDAAQESGEFSSVIERMSKVKRLFVVPKPPSVLGGLRLRVLWKSYMLYRYCKEGNIEVLHTALSATLYAAVLTFVSSRIKIIAEVTSPDVVEALKKPIWRLLRRRVAVFHTVSPSVMEQLRRVEISKTTAALRTICAPLPFFSIPPDITVTRKKSKLIVYAARLIERKNPLMLAEAAKELLDKRPGWQVAILGAGPLEKEIRHILSAQIDSGRVIVGYTPDVYSLLSRSVIFVSLIEPDNYPSQSILEAMAMENAIVANASGETHKFVSDANGILIELSASALLDALLTLTGNIELTLKKGTASRRILEKDFPSESYVAHLVEVYHQAGSLV